MFKRHPLGFSIHVRGLHVYVNRDFWKRPGFSTGIYQNFGEHVDFRYICLQVRGIGQIDFTWEAL